MKNINYDEYLATLGDFETNQKNIIKKYLEEQCKNDEALKTLYRPNKLDDCYEFIKECAKRKASGGSAYLEDAVVFKMARDFYLDILPKADEGAPEIKPAEVKKVQKTVEEVADQIKEDAAAEPEEEELAIQSVEQEEKPEEQSEEVQYDKDGQGMLFAF